MNRFRNSSDGARCVGASEGLNGNSDALIEAAIKSTWGMVDPLAPPPAGSYDRGFHEGVCSSLMTLRDNLKRLALLLPQGGPAKDLDALWSGEAALRKTAAEFLPKTSPGLDG